MGTFIDQLGALVWAGSDPRLYFPCLLSRDIHCIQDPGSAAAGVLNLVSDIHACKILGLTHCVNLNTNTNV